jgi:Tol biopolymer transport system component
MLRVTLRIMPILAGVLVLVLLLPLLVGSLLPYSGRELAYLAFDEDRSRWQVNRFDLASGLNIAMPDPGFSPISLAWRADGSGFLVTQGFSGREMVELDLDGTWRTLVGRSQRDWNPVQSPDGEHIIFLSGEEISPLPSSYLYLMDSDGGDLRRLSDDRGYDDSPAWSPDSRRLLFRRARVRGDGLYTIDLDGTMERLDIDLSSISAPSWSPDGKRIVFVARRGMATNNVFTYDLVTGVLTAITSGSFEDRDPRWSPDGERIVFVSNREGGSDFNLYVMNPDGSGLRMIYDGAEILSSPTWRP